MSLSKFVLFCLYTLIGLFAMLMGNLIIFAIEYHHPLLDNFLLTVGEPLGLTIVFIFKLIILLFLIKIFEKGVGMLEKIIKEKEKAL